MIALNSSPSARRSGLLPPVPEPSVLGLDLDRPTPAGISLREAMAVRSAELWLALGERRLALRELDALSAAALQHAWPLHVQLRATLNHI
jgi:hypothetical protein